MKAEEAKMAADTFHRPHIEEYLKVNGTVEKIIIEIKKAAESGLYSLEYPLGNVNPGLAKHIETEFIISGYFVTIHWDKTFAKIIIDWGR